MKMEKLNATLQKDYYGKAKFYILNGIYVLRSYNTDVCAYDRKTDTFVRFWGGYSATTMKHVNDFRLMFGLSKLTKKEWLALASNKADKYKVIGRNACGIVHKSMVVFDDYTDALTYADSLNKMHGKSGLWYFEPLYVG